MMKSFRIAVLIFAWTCLCPKISIAQPAEMFERITKKLFNEDLFATGIASPAITDIFLLEAREAFLNIRKLITTNVASFPLTSTIAGVTIDLQTGVPELITESLGPIFGERAETIGKGKFYFGLNYSSYNLSEFRGLPIEDFQLTITIDANRNGLLGGSNPNDLIDNDTIDFFPGLKLNAGTFVFYSTYGLTHNLDVGVAVPWINLNLNGTAKAVINSITLIQLGQAVFNYNDNVLNPQLTDTVDYESSVSGIGDIALRLKYSFAQGSGLNFATFMEYRFPTGNEENFLGTGEPSAKFSAFFSKKIGNFNPHINIGYDRRWANNDSDEFEFLVGFDQKLTNGITFALDIIGEIDLQSDEAINILPGTKTITRTRFPGQASYEEIINRSNIPVADYDHLFNAAIGFKIAPSDRLLFLGNALVPLNNGGIRSNIIPTFGISIIL